VRFGGIAASPCDGVVAWRSSPPGWSSLSPTTLLAGPWA